MEPETMIVEKGAGVGRITLDRPERGNGLTPQLIRELAESVEELDLDPSVRVIVLAGNGTGFCGGYDLVASAEKMLEGEFGSEDAPKGSPLDPRVQAANHDPSRTWDPMVDYAGM
ncbi:MAG: enoyl-CoA hydratase/isomerase family protein, partial [Solirubrobacterales bacterium]|nr:enoyl-CoA hydratase/isomerase family protein [Solirubrobacterales bacterium]